MRDEFTAVGQSSFLILLIFAVRVLISLYAITFARQVTIPEGTDR